MMKKIGTVEDFINGKLTGHKCYTDTAWGYHEISHVQWPKTNPWVVCPKMNGGYGQSFMVSYDTPLYREETK